MFTTFHQITYAISSVKFHQEDQFPFSINPFKLTFLSMTSTIFIVFLEHKKHQLINTNRNRIYLVIKADIVTNELP